MSHERIRIHISPSKCKETVSIFHRQNPPGIISFSFPHKTNQPCPIPCDTHPTKTYYSCTKCTQMFILQSLEWHLNKSCYYSTNIQNSKPQGPTSITFSIESPTAISTPLLSVKIQAQATLSKTNQALMLQLIM